MLVIATTHLFQTALLAHELAEHFRTFLRSHHHPVFPKIFLLDSLAKKAEYSMRRSCCNAATGANYPGGAKDGRDSPDTAH